MSSWRCGEGPVAGEGGRGGGGWALLQVLSFESPTWGGRFDLPP